jgi:hypothetical protein
MLLSFQVVNKRACGEFGCADLSGISAVISVSFILVITNLM